MIEKQYDVLGLGCVAVDEVLYVPSFPLADEKTAVVRSEQRFGGLTGTALITAASLGARCCYAGCLGTDAISEHVMSHLAMHGVDLTHAPRLTEGRVVHSTIVVGQDTGSRNIFYKTDGMIGAHPSLPEDDVVRSCNVLLLDNFGMPGNLRAAQIARLNRISIVADFEDDAAPLFDDVLALVDHLVLSEKMAQRLTGASTPAEAARVLWARNRAAVVVTCGDRGCWSLEGVENSPRHHPAFSVKATDTTGCGDVFHGAYAASLARGESLDERIAFASAAAALKASHPGIPAFDSVQALLASRVCSPNP